MQLYIHTYTYGSHSCYIYSTNSLEGGLEVVYCNEWSYNDVNAGWEYVKTRKWEAANNLKEDGEVII